jgi:16S rRNA (uracil1498-N3)-methyltransferase
MNLLLLEAQQFLSDNRAITSKRQAEHIVKTLKLGLGSSITLGKVNGLIGRGTIAEINAHAVTVDAIEFHVVPPAQLPITLILGMPRPQMLKRIVQTIATMGVTKLYLVQTHLVEKSFWQSASATDRAIDEHLKLGLEQGFATQLPHVEKYQRFTPFMRDILPDLTENSSNIIAHPNGLVSCPCHEQNEAITLAIGPEGGFIESEVSLFEEAGFTAASLGSRILKVETAVPVLLAKLYRN